MGLSKKRILVVDDSESMRQHVAHLLRGEGFEVLEAEDGLDALEKLDAAGPVQLVLSDVRMPRMDGLGLLAAIAARPEAQRPPVVMLTTERDPALLTRAREAGAKGWLIKPFKPEIVLTGVRRVLGVG